MNGSTPMSQVSTFLFWSLAPYVVIIVPAVAIVAIRYKEYSRWFLLLFICPYAGWIASALLATQRATSLANLSLEPRLVAAVVDICFAPDIAELRVRPTSYGRVVVALIVCTCFAVWVGTWFPEMQE